MASGCFRVQIVQSWTAEPLSISIGQVRELMHNLHTQEMFGETCVPFEEEATGDRNTPTEPALAGSRRFGGATLWRLR